MTQSSIYNMTRCYTSTTGTGTLTLGAAVPSFLTFAGAGVANGTTVSYVIEDGTQRECGQGVYSAGTLTRATVYSSTNGNALLSLYTGAAQVYIDVLASDFVQLGTPNVWTAQQVFLSNVNATASFTLGQQPSFTGGIVGGAGYVPGTYTNVPLTTVSGSGTGARATIVVVQGRFVSSVSTVTITAIGSEYTPGTVLSCLNTYIGGAGSGWSITVQNVVPLTGALAIVGSTGQLTLLSAASEAGPITIANVASVGSGNYTLSLPQTPGMSGEYLQTDGTGVLSWSLPSSGIVNVLRNGNFDIWQRGTSLTVTTSGGYTSDGWFVLPTGGSITVNALTGSNTSVYGLNIVGATGITDVQVKHVVESFMAAKLSGSVATFQITVVNNTSASIASTLSILGPNVADNYGAFSYFVEAEPFTIPEGTSTLSYTFYAGSANKGMEIIIDLVGSLNADGNTVTFTAADMRSTPGAPQGFNTTFFQPELRPYPIELTICQRYLYVANTQFIGLATTAEFLSNPVTWPEIMITTPTISNASFYVSTGLQGTVAMQSAGPQSAQIYNNLTTWTPSAGVSLSATFSAEITPG